MIRITVASVFISWLLLSAAAQVNAVRNTQDKSRWTRVLGWVDGWLGLIPRWTFFAPRPGINDFSLLYRFRTADGELSRWFGVTPATAVRWRDAIWNPGKREKKALMDYAAELSCAIASDYADTGGGRLGGIVVSNAYIAMLSYVEQVAAEVHGARSVQFLVVAIQAQERCRILVASRVHEMTS
jgi:hypothetical protein